MQLGFDLGQGTEINTTVTESFRDKLLQTNSRTKFFDVGSHQKKLSHAVGFVSILRLVVLSETWALRTIEFVFTFGV